MTLEKKQNLRTQITSLFMALIMTLAMSGMPFTTAYAASSGPSGIFDVVGDDGTVGTVGEGGEQGFATVISQYRAIAVAITGILTITMLIFMLIQFTKLGASGDNEMARKKAIMGILTTGIATALLGGATIVVGFFWNVLSSTGVYFG